MGWKKLSGFGGFCEALSNFLRGQLFYLKREGTHTPSDPAAVWCGSGNTFCSLTSGTGAPVRSVWLPVRVWEENDANHSQTFHATAVKLILFSQLSPGSRRDIKHEKLGVSLGSLLVTTFSSSPQMLWQGGGRKFALCIWFGGKKSRFSYCCSGTSSEHWLIGEELSQDNTIQILFVSGSRLRHVADL